MKKRIMTLAILVLSFMGLSACIASDQGFTVGELCTTPLLLREIEVEWITGNCYVFIHDSDELYAYEKTDEADTDHRMRWELKDGKLTIRFCKPRLFGQTVSYQKTLYLYLPKSLLAGMEYIKIATVSANLTVEGLETEQLDLTTVSGVLAVQDVSCQSGKMASVSAEMTVENCHADVLTIANVSGNVVLTDCDALQSLTVSTVSGDQTVAIPLGCRELSLDSVSGNLAAKLPDALSFAITCMSESGTVSAEESLCLAISGGTYTRGDGGLTGEITAVSGNIMLQHLPRES